MIPEPDAISVPEPLPEDLAELALLVQKTGLTSQQAAAYMGEVTEIAGSCSKLLELKNKTSAAPGDLERLLLHWAGVHHLPQLAGQPVPETVKKLWRQEWAWMQKPTAAASLALGSPGFEAAAKIATLRRFPAGPMDWETSGIPRSWLFKTQRKTDSLKLSAFIASRLGGFAPLLFLHMGRKPRNRTLILEAEVMKMYRRACRAVEMQPQSRGLMAYGWFHDPAALAQNPHLEWLNRPYRDAGGLLVNLGPVDAGSGVAEGNATRRQSLAEGSLAYRIGLALWPREAMLEWARRNPQWTDSGPA